MLIDGIGISGYRSFGGNLQKIGPFNKVNLFIGQNNSGKSNILLFLTEYYHKALICAQTDRNGFNARNSSLQFEPLDRHLGEGLTNTGKNIFSFALTYDGRIYNDILGKYKNQLKQYSRISDLIERVCKSKTLTQGTNTAWFSYELLGGRLTLSNDSVSNIKSENLFGNHLLNDNEQWENLFGILNSSSGGDIERWISGTLRILSPVNIEPPKVNLIPAIRKIGGEEKSVVDDYSGIGIIDRLAQLQDPDHDEQHLKQSFEEINEFLRKVIDNQTASLGIPYKRDKILVHMDKKTLPLSNLGTGVHEVIMLAAAATILQNQVLCIEEPELHLHPLLQKKLIRYLSEKTSNQYFITTHSAHLLDTPGAAIFHVRHQNGYTTVDPVYTATDKSLICTDLGYRASDLLQANCIIWVEGPSDRIYLNHWIHQLDHELIDHELIEGLHYSIMFYGGKLLSHLSASDPEVDDFISLRRLNRYIAIVIDSDRSGAHGRINETKKRIREEFDKGPGFAWITKGREIENYIDPKLLGEIVKGLYQKAVHLAGTGPYDHCLHYKARNGTLVKEADKNKVKVAREVAKHPANLEILDLKQMVTKLIQFINEVN